MAQYQLMDDVTFALLYLEQIDRMDIASQHNILGKMVYKKHTGLLISQISDSEVVIWLILYNSSGQITDSLKLFYEDAAYNNPMYGSIQNGEILLTTRKEGISTLFTIDHEKGYFSQSQPEGI